MMALPMNEYTGPREGEMKGNMQKSRKQLIDQPMGRKLWHKHSYRSNVIGNLKEGQGYADKRKRRFINNYQKLKRKQRLQAQKKNSGNENDSIPSDINLFSQNNEKDNIDATHAKAAHGPADTRTRKEASHDGSQTMDEKTEERTEKKKRFKKRGGKKNAKNRFSKAQHEFHEKRRAEEMRLQTIKQQQAERALALERYSKKKMEQHQKLKKTTRRGQPLMKYHMEALLDKIKAQGT